MDQLLTPAELAEYMHTTVASLAQDRYRGRGVPFVKRGSRVLYRASDVAKYLADNTFQGTEQTGVA
ncbi:MULTISPECIES: helix-turn-helix domain-containing protein [unclassified Nocardia]|uniref:helix-turn-helix domain-containing protein n=1 Tax=unclassified Nocardia TaxID=2637762 RepID=UPI0027E20AF6|nr:MULTISPECIES: helix-turn-helix domain-containing protein [unclassified Nocardia]